MEASILKDLEIIQSKIQRQEVNTKKNKSCGLEVKQNGGQVQMRFKQNSQVPLRKVKDLLPKLKIEIVVLDRSMDLPRTLLANY